LSRPVTRSGHLADDAPVDSKRVIRAGRLAPVVVLTAAVFSAVAPVLVGAASDTAQPAESASTSGLPSDAVCFQEGSVFTGRIWVQVTDRSPSTVEQLGGLPPCVPWPNPVEEWR
jgi:hypothetical protein